MRSKTRPPETQPACLQRLTGRLMLSGGMTAYGLDQIALRAEQLADKYSPSVIIVRFIEADLHLIVRRHRVENLLVSALPPGPQHRVGKVVDS